MLGDLLTAGLSGFLFGIPLLLFGYILFAALAELAVRMVTDGDHKGTFIESYGYDYLQFKFFGKNLFRGHGALILVGGVLTAFFSALFFLLSYEYMTNNPGSMYLVNPFTEVVSIAFGLFLVIYSNLLFAKVIYKLTKKVTNLKNSLKAHMADKSAHKGN